MTTYIAAPGISGGLLNTAGSLFAFRVNYSNPVGVNWTTPYVALYNEILCPCSSSLMYVDAGGVFHFLLPGTYVCRLYYQFQGSNASAGLTASVYVNGSLYCMPFQQSLTNCYSGTYVTPQMLFMVQVSGVIPTNMFVQFACSNTALSSNIPATASSSTYSTINYYS